MRLEEQSVHIGQLYLIIVKEEQLMAQAGTRLGLAQADSAMIRPQSNVEETNKEMSVLPYQCHI